MVMMNERLAMAQPSPKHSPLYRRTSHTLLQERTGLQPISWIKVADTPPVNASENSTVMPVFPLNAVHWPGSEVTLNIIDPAYRRMYDDIILSGSRRFLMPWSPCVPGFPRGRIRFKQIPEDERQLHAVGMVLYLQDLRELSGETDDRVKYQCKHVVIGRACMKRLLNPSALFTTNEEGFKVDYLRAEVEMYDELTDRVDSTLTKTLANDLFESWQDMASAASKISSADMVLKFDEEKLNNLRNYLNSTRTWKLAEFWQNFQLSLRVGSEQARIYGELKQWVEEQRALGKIPADTENVEVPLEALPRPLLQKLQQIQNGEAGLELGVDFWEPFLRLQAAEGSRERGELLIEAVREEERRMRVRAALEDTLG